MPARSKSLIGMLWAIAFIGLTGMRAPAQTGGPDHADDPRWSQFRGVAVKTDLKKGVATAIFPPELLAANGKVMDIGGYIVPLEASPDSSHFLLTRRLTGCPFTASKVHYVQHQVFIRGRLKLVESSDAGLFFQFREATAS
jgi:hypothetical protein